MATVFFMSKFKEGADRQAYRRWVIEYDYPTCKKNFSSIVNYTTFEVDKNENPDSPWDVIEHIDLTGLEEYKRDMASPEFQELLSRWSRFMDAETALMVFAGPIQ